MIVIEPNDKMIEEMFCCSSMMDLMIDNKTEYDEVRLLHQILLS